MEKLVSGESVVKMSDLDLENVAGGGGVLNGFLCAINPAQHPFWGEALGHSLALCFVFILGCCFVKRKEIAKWVKSKL